MRTLLVALLLASPVSAAAQADAPATPEEKPAATPATAEEPAEGVPTPPVTDVVAPAVAPEGTPVVEEAGEPHPCGCKKGEHGGKEEARFDLRFDGHLRVEGTTIMPDRFFGIRMPASYVHRSLPNVGRNDGFVLGDARLNLRATYHDNLYVRLGFDGAVAGYKDSGDTAGELTTGLKDAYLRYTFARPLTVFVGRFKPPFDVEELTPTEDQFFVHRALESRGVERHEGPHGDLFGRSDVSGFAPGRQIGVMMGSDAALQGEGFKVGYALAMTNGNANDAAFNDNDLPAFYGRGFIQIAGSSDGDDEEGPATFRRPQGALVGLSGFYNDLSYGQAPNRYRDRVTGLGVDAAWHFMAFYLQGQLLAARTDAVSRKDLDPVYALGGHVQVAVQIPGTGFFPGYRFAMLDPRRVLNSTLAGSSTDIDRVALHTVGVRYQAAELPLTGAVEYTHSVEQGGRAQPNDRVEAALQVNFQ